jgi:hypothetical protein
MAPAALHALLTAPTSTEPPLPLWVRVVSALGPALVLAGAVFGAVLAALISWRSSRRDRWWTKTQWAIERVHCSSSHEQDLGIAMLGVLVDQAPSREESALIGEAMEPILARFPARADDEDVADYRLTEEERRVIAVTPTEKRAAQVRVKADQRSGRETPTFIKAVAEAKAR